MTVDPTQAPGRRAYIQARKLIRAKRRMWLPRVTAVPTEPGKVLQFRPRETPPDNEETA